MGGVLLTDDAPITFMKPLSRENISQIKSITKIKRNDAPLGLVLVSLVIEITVCFDHPSTVFSLFNTRVFEAKCGIKFG